MNLKPKTFNLKPIPRGFTLVELLGVMAIILMLAGLLYPTMTSIRNQAKIAKAHAEMDGLKIALRAYYQEYGYWPDVTNWGNLSSMLNGNNAALNPRGIRFYDFSKSSLNAQGELLDPWGNPYNVVLDNGGNWIGTGPKDDTAEDGQTNTPAGLIQSSIAIYADDPQGGTNYITSW